MRAPEVVQDHRVDYVPPSGTDEATILVCEGAGAWSTGDTVGVRIKVTIDADEEVFVKYGPIR